MGRQAGSSPPRAAGCASRVRCTQTRCQRPAGGAGRWAGRRIRNSFNSKLEPPAHPCRPARSVTQSFLLGTGIPGEGQWGAKEGAGPRREGRPHRVEEGRVEDGTGRTGRVEEEGASSGRCGQGACASKAREDNLCQLFPRLPCVHAPCPHPPEDARSDLGLAGPDLDLSMHHDQPRQNLPQALNGVCLRSSPPSWASLCSSRI